VYISRRKATNAAKHFAKTGAGTEMGRLGKAKAHERHAMIA
jgi:hypothetical protein